MLKQWLKAVPFLIFSLPVLSAASSPVQCKNYGFLKQGFHLNDYTNCQSLIHQCPKQGLLPDQACVKQVIEKHQSCYQLKALSAAINGDPATISAEPMAKFTIIDQVFIADGQHSYYLISPQGCLVNTNIDPRVLSPSLKKQYKNTEFMHVNWDKPTSQNHPNGSQSFIATLKVTDTCLACKVIGWAKIRFDFAKNGILIKTSLESFRKGSTK
jgi:hypothetical protein